MSNPKNAADAFLAAIKVRMNLRTDQDLAVRFGLGKSTIASWRMRGEIPAPHLRQLEDYSGIPFIQFQRDRFATMPLVAWLVEMSVLWALSEYFADKPAAERRRAAIHLTAEMAALRQLATDRIFDTTGGEMDLNTYVELGSNALGGEFLKPSEIASAVEKLFPLPSAPEGPQHGLKHAKSRK